MLVTSLEAVETTQATQVELPDRVRTVGRVLGMDEESGLAVIQLNSGISRQQMSPETSENGLGWVVALGLNKMASPVMSFALLTSPGSGMLPASLPFTSAAAIHRPVGSRGAAVVDIDGRLLGYLPADPTRQAVWGNRLSDLVRQLKAQGRILRPWIGLEVSRIDPAILNHLKLSSGLLVAAVFPQGPAWRAGIKPGDVLVEVNQHPIQTAEEYRGILLSLSEGASCQLQLMRRGRTLSRTVTVRLRSEQRRLAAGGTWVPSLGAALKRERRTLSVGVGKLSGLQVAFLEAGGPAFAAGIRKGDLLLALDQRALMSPNHLRRRYERSSRQEFLVKLLRGEKQHLILLKKAAPDEAP